MSLSLMDSWFCGANDDFQKHTVMSKPTESATFRFFYYHPFFIAVPNKTLQYVAILYRSLSAVFKFYSILEK